SAAPLAALKAQHTRRESRPMTSNHTQASSARHRPGSPPGRAGAAQQARAHPGLPNARNPPRQGSHWLPDRSRPPQRRPRSAARGKVVTLRDGSPVLVRQVQAADVPLLADIFARLSPTSRWMRFLAAKNHLTEAELRYLTDIDHHDHEALAALDRPGG